MLPQVSFDVPGLLGTGVFRLRPRQILLLCAACDLLGVLGMAALLDRFAGTGLQRQPAWLVSYALVYIAFSWLFGSYTLLRWPRLDLPQLVVRLLVTNLATALVVVLVYWLLNLPETFTLGHRRVQLMLLSGLSLWALAVRLLLWRLSRARKRHGLSLLEHAEREQQRLLPAHLPEQALGLEDLPWSNPLGVQRQLKRSADVALALLLLLATLPLLLLAGLLIWLEDRGPVFYVQQRSGLMGRCFQLYKLRTMCEAAPDAPATWTVRGDARITRTGAFLRRMRLDELPQLWNVLRGDMSLIGPRPERPELEHDLESRIPHYRKRHWMPPGLSGWAQVSAPYAASVEEAELKLSYDLYYLRHWGNALDLLILLKTIKTVLKARGR